MSSMSITARPISTSKASIHQALSERSIIRGIAGHAHAHVYTNVDANSNSIGLVLYHVVFITNYLTRIYLLVLMLMVTMLVLMLMTMRMGLRLRLLQSMVRRVGLHGRHLKGTWNGMPMGVSMRM